MKELCKQEQAPVAGEGFGWREMSRGWGGAGEIEGSHREERKIFGDWDDEEQEEEAEEAKKEVNEVDENDAKNGIWLLGR